MGVFIAYGVLTDRFLTALILTDCSQLTETYCCYSCLDLLSMISQQLSVAETTSLKSLRLRKLRDLSQFVLSVVKLREREGQRVDLGRSLKGHLKMVVGG